MGVESVQKNGKICILDIDVQGAELVKKSSLNVRTKEATVLGECLLLFLFFIFSDTVFSNDMNIFACILDDKQQYVSYTKHRTHVTRTTIPHHSLQWQPIFIFIAPPSQEELEKRLRGRGTETEEAIQTRLGNAAKELAYGNAAGNFDRIFVNADLKATFEDMASFFKEKYPHLNEVAPDDDETKNCACVIS